MIPFWVGPIWKGEVKISEYIQARGSQLSYYREVPLYNKIEEREFVLYPLSEIYNDFTFPDGTTLSQLLTKVDRNGLTIWQA